MKAKIQKPLGRIKKQEICNHKFKPNPINKTRGFGGDIYETFECYYCGFTKNCVREEYASEINWNLLKK